MPETGPVRRSPPKEKPLTFGSLFAGIGGFDLGLERAGLRCRWQVEINDYSRRILAKHWPEVRRHDDVTTFPPEETGWEVDAICGGFPCQDISYAGKGAGIAEGTRSGLWSEYVRVIRLLRPTYVLVENVAALLTRGLGRVLGDLAESGYDAEWDCIPAAFCGANHLRYRTWIVAYPDRQRRAQLGPPAVAGQANVPRRGRAPGDGPDPASAGRQAQPPRGKGKNRTRPAGPFDALGRVLADTASRGRKEGGSAKRQREASQPAHGREMADADRVPREMQDRNRGREPRYFTGHAGSRPDYDWWAVEPPVGRVVDGIPGRVDRITALGNAVVPQVAEYLGRRLVAFHQERVAYAESVERQEAARRG